MWINRTLVAVLPLIVVAACSDSAPPELVERFRLTCASLAARAAADETPIVVGSDGWYFAADETAVLGAAAPSTATAVRGISAAAARLQRDGIELVVAPVPPKGIIYPDRLAPELEVPIPVRRLDATLQNAYRDMRAQGVRVVDLTEPFIRERFHPEGPLYCRQDSHWSGVGCVVAAQIIGARVRELDVLEVEAARPYGLAWFMTPIRGDLWQLLPQPPPREELRTRGLIGGSEDPLLAPVVRNGDAPVAVVGDTHVLVFHAGEPYHARGAGVADQLAFELRQSVALHADEGDGPAGAWTLPALGERTQFVIWIFAATRLLDGV